MIVIPAGWTAIQHLRSMELVPARGAAVASILYRERVRPLLHVGALVRQFLEAHPELVCSKVPECERLLTAEGEHAALVTLAGIEAGRLVQRDLGFVFGDDFYALIATACYEPEQFDELTRLARDLVISDMHELGVRRRRFEYTPMPSWQPMVRGFITDWFPRDYPNDAVQVTVYPASPSTRTPHAITQLLLGRFIRDAVPERDICQELILPSGLRGELTELVVPSTPGKIVKLCAVLTDSTFIYPIEVTARDVVHVDGHRGELGELVASMQPIPERRRETHRTVAFDFWAQ